MGRGLISIRKHRNRMLALSALDTGDTGDIAIYCRDIYSKLVTLSTLNKRCWEMKGTSGDVIRGLGFQVLGLD